MDQDKLIDEIEDKILDSLPFEAIEKLAKMDGEGISKEKIGALLSEYGVNAVEITKNAMNKEKNNGQ